MNDAEMARLLALLRIPSVGALPEHAADMERAAEAVADEIRRAGGAPRLVRSGGALPILAAMVERMPTVLTGFALPDDAIHSPNERMLVENLGTGVRAAMGILEGLGR